jgi:hypothetical protein
LSSVGVGDAEASPTAALLLNIFQESVGRIATIAFADRFGTALEPECKMYRLLADVFNDIAFVLDCLSPALPKPIRVIILSCSSVLRALCGVAAGSAKASLSAHFARWGNLGELNAKDSSQETVISLLGMLAGTLVVSWVTTPMATWTTLILLLGIHLETNRRAVRAVSMRTLNRQRATIVFHHLERGHVPTPEEVSKDEAIFERDGVLRNADRKILGHCMVGASIVTPMRSMSFRRPGKHSMLFNNVWLEKTTSMNNRHYLLMLKEGSSAPYLYVVLEKHATPVDVLAAWWQALEFAELCRKEQGANKALALTAGDEVFKGLERCAIHAGNLIAKYRPRLVAAGWDLDTGALETTSSPRISFTAGTKT